MSANTSLKHVPFAVFKYDRATTGEKSWKNLFFNFQKVKILVNFSSEVAKEEYSFCTYNCFEPT